MSWNSGGGAHPYGQSPGRQQQHHYHGAGGQQHVQQEAMILQQQSLTAQQHGGFAPGGFQQHQVSQSQVYSGDVASTSPHQQHHQHQTASVAQQPPQMIAVSAGPPGQVPHHAWAGAAGGVQQPGVVYTMQAPMPVQLPVQQAQQAQAQAVYSWQQSHFQDPGLAQQQAVAYLQPGATPYQHHLSGTRGSPGVGAGGADRGVISSAGASYVAAGGGAGGGSSESPGGAGGGWHTRGEGARGGDKKRGRGEEQAAKAKGKGKASSKGGSKASRREAGGGARGAGQGFPQPAAPGGGGASLIDDDRHGDGVPYANIPHNQPSASDSSSNGGGSGGGNVNRAQKKKKCKKGEGRGAWAPSPTGIGPTPRPAGMAVTGVDRKAGLGHWADITKKAENVDAIELDPGKRAASAGRDQAGAAAAAAAAGGGSGSGASGVRAPLPLARHPVGGEPPTPMKECPSGGGGMVIDQVAHDRMYPGGAKLNVKAFKLKQKSAVSAAFELCVSFEPKARPTFEFKDGKRTATSPFTLHVRVNGVDYTPATAKTIKLAKQLASINFLREAMGTRPQLNLESLIAEAGGSVAGNAAVAAKIQETAKKPKPKQAGGGDGGGDGAASTDGGGEESEDAVANLALDSGEPNYTQVLHDLVAAHPECPTYTSYSFKPLKDYVGKKQKTRGRGFRCTARLLRHTVDPVLTAQKQKEEEEKRAVEAAAKAAVAADPTNPELLDEARKAHKAVLRARAVPMLEIKVLSATGDGPSKRDAKHTAAQAMIYLLLPGCKTEEQMRAMAKAIMDKYQTEKKARMEEEQRVAQKAKGLREQAKALNARAEEAGRSGTPAEAAAAEAAAAAAAVAAAEAQEDVARVHQPKGETRHDKAMRVALDAATKTAQVRMITGEPGISSSDSEGHGGYGSSGAGAGAGAAAVGAAAGPGARGAAVGAAAGPSAAAAARGGGADVGGVAGEAGTSSRADMPVVETDGPAGDARPGAGAGAGAAAAAAAAASSSPSPAALASAAPASAAPASAAPASAAPTAAAAVTPAAVRASSRTRLRAAAPRTTPTRSTRAAAAAAAAATATATGPGDGDGDGDGVNPPEESS